MVKEEDLNVNRVECAQDGDGEEGRDEGGFGFAFTADLFALVPEHSPILDS